MVSYLVHVSSIGTVYEGGSKKTAAEIYRDYRKQSQSGLGRAAGEDVMLLVDGEICLEFFGDKTKIQLSDKGEIE